ncbi:MAG: N,N-dimethylformamidase beta subunit family domain-containing protein, partial [Steroidobacteraceae bacterium]
TMWWQVRYSDDQSQLICYKDAPDPVADPLLQTVNWNSESLDFPIVPSIGAEFPRGGYGREKRDKGWDGFRILQPGSPIFRGLKIQRRDVIHMPTVEYDGAPLLNNPVTEGEPQLDLAALGAFRAELIGYDYGARGGADTVGTWLVYQRTSSSGIVINGASTNWCSASALEGKSAAQVKQIILNMIELLLGSEPVFTN